MLGLLWHQDKSNLDKLISYVIQSMKDGKSANPQYLDC